MALTATSLIRKGNIELSTTQLVATISELQAAVTSLVTLANELKTDYNAVLTKLDADAGVTDTNYAATRAIAAADVTL